MSADRPLRMLGLIACIAVATIAIATSGVGVLLVGALVAFVALFWFATSAAPIAWRLVAIAMQAAVAIAIAAAGLMPRLEGALLAIAAAQTLFVVPLRISIAS